MNFVDGFNKLWAQVDSSGGVTAVLAVIGVAIIAVALGKWFWDKRRGGGAMSGFPWMLIGLGAILAGPQITVPALLTILQALVNVVVNLVTWFGNLLGG